MQRSGEAVTKPSVEQVVELLCRVRPALHGPADIEPLSLGMKREVLRYMAGVVRAGLRSLETGCGQSTILLAAAGARHTAVSPFAAEYERIGAFCEEHGIALDGVEFLTGDSRDVLPTLGGEPLDFVLIDGCHSFPSPFIDWFYSARRLRKGGLLVVDDTQIVTGSTLRDFLAAEAGRWRLVQEFRRTSVFEKLEDNVTDGFRWRQQPFCERTHRFRKLETVVRPLYEAVFRRRRPGPLER